MKRLRKSISIVAVTALVATNLAAGTVLFEDTAHAAQTNGTAPYINQWAVTGPFATPVINGGVMPVIGESFADSKWQYFDDRIFNRNYDDYNDLMGYFDVKQGVDTLDKWVVAATYVYSPTKQTVSWQVAGSSVYKLYANDVLSGQQTSVPSRVNKDGTKYSIELQQGWNKLFIEIQHKKPSASQNYLGFYSRLSDNSGNEIPDLTYSVTGPNTTNNDLTIVTEGLSINKNEFDARNVDIPANDYPSNILPIAYDENPYVWMEATSDGNPHKSSIAPQASPFTFQAAGGDPSYTWEISDGQLPPGLTLTASGEISGHVADGAQGTSKQHDYTFTVKVTDGSNASTTKQYTITVKENPVDWFIEGKMSALTHTTGTYPNLYDPNYNFDAWAQTAKELGMTMLSTETLQNTIYYWPSPNANLTPNDSNKLYKYNALYQTEDGAWQVKDRVMQAKEAVERYGMKFGVYVSSQYEGRNIIETDIQALIERYDPWYLFVDGGPESYSTIDVAWSSARNYNDRVLIDTNPNAQTGDQDITLHERPFWHSEPYNEGSWRNGILKQTKKVAHEEWNDPFTTALDVWAQYAKGNERDNWVQLTKEIINQYGHGYVMNYDQSIGRTRGMDNLSSNLDNANVFAMVPIESENALGMRTSIANWMSNANGGPDLRESMYGTLPYTLDYTLKSGWYTDPQKAIAHGQGPEWGYAMARDQYVYMHMIENMISGTSKKGFTGEDSMSDIGPFNYPVSEVEWLNEGTSLPFTTEQKEGKYYITIDTSSVVADPIDTVLKITTEDQTRNYKMTSVKLFSSQATTDKLQLKAEPYMNSYTNIFAPATLSYTSDKTDVATVDAATGLVTAVGAGKATITVTATYDDGVNAVQVKTDTYPVKVSEGAISADLPLVGVNLFTEDALFWGQFSTNKDLAVTFQGFTEKGGTVDILNGDNITYHYATVDGNRNNPTGKVIVTEVPVDQVPFNVEDGTMQFTDIIKTPTMYSYWADITVDGETFTSTRNYITLIPDVNVAAGITPTVTSDSSNADKLSDGIINDAAGGNRVKWTAPATDTNPEITYDLGKLHNLTRLNIFFNHRMPNKDNVTYYNVPKKMKIEYSADGVNWTAGNETNTLSGGGLPTARNTLAVPEHDKTLYAWEQEGLYYNYPIDPSKAEVQARYVRVSFPGGGQGGNPIDVLEVRMFAAGDLSALGNIQIDPQIGSDSKTVTVDVDGYSYLGDTLDLSDAKITITSDNTAVASVDTSGVIKAVAAGKAKINVTTSLKGYSASEYFYVDVDADGKVHLNPFLKEAKLTIDNRLIKLNKPIVGTLEGLLSNGELIDLSTATVEYQFSDNRLSVIEGSNTIVVSGNIGNGFKATVTAKVTFDGVTLVSDPVAISAAGENIAPSANVTVISYRSNDARYVGPKAVDGDRSTSWASSPNDNTKGPWIRLEFDAPQTIGKLNLVDRGHKVNEIGEGLLEWEGGSKKVENIKWDGQPDNFVTFDEPIVTNWIKFTIDPDNKFANVNGSEQGELGLAEFEVFEAEEQSVKSVIDYSLLTVNTTQDVIPTLPAQVQAVYNNGTTELVNVTWDPITADMVANEGVYAVYGTVEGTSLKAKAIYKVAAKSVSTGYILTVTGDVSVIAGETFAVTNVLGNVAEFVYALDQTIHYDPTQVEFLSVEALQSGFTIVGQKEEAGQVRILMASSGPGSAIKNMAPVLKLNFKAKETSQSLTSSISLTDVAVAGSNGIEVSVSNGSAYTIDIIVVDKAALQDLITTTQASHDSAVEGAGIGQYPIGSKATLQAAIDRAKAVASQGGATQDQVDQEMSHLQLALQKFTDSVNVAAPGDLNGDGKFSIGDLGLVAAGNGKTSADVDWDKYKRADMNGDGQIDIVDIAKIASLILG